MHAITKRSQKSTSYLQLIASPFHMRLDFHNPGILRKLLQLERIKRFRLIISQDVSSKTRGSFSASGEKDHMDVVSGFGRSLLRNNVYGYLLPKLYLYRRHHVQHGFLGENPSSQSHH